MSRISRYQESMAKFMKQKSYLSSLQTTDIDNNIKSNLDEMINECDHVIGILLLTVMNSQGKKSNQSIHGYGLATGIEIMLYTTMIIDDRDYYETRFGRNNVEEIINRTGGIVNICLSNNIESIQDNYTGTTYTKLLKIIHYVTKLLNSRMHKLLSEPIFEFESNITKTDVIKYKFDNNNGNINELAKSKIKKLKKIKKDKLDEYINDRYGFVCQTALITGWLLGGGSDKIIPSLEKLGLQFANMIKSIKDFVNLKSDLEHAKIYTKNTVINNGFQLSFETFIENKNKFIEGCIKHNIYTNTVKEIIDLMESKLDGIINESSPDMASHYTLTAS